MLNVNEIYGPVQQGEGKSAGKEVFFLRLIGCSLRCQWCDSKYTWDWKKYDPKKEIHLMTTEEVFAKLKKLGKDLRALVITGGEPLLQQKALIPLLELLAEEAYEIEMETNGTILPTEEFLELVDQINCSPKLSNSGPDNTEEKRIKSEALTRLSNSPKTNFKFVVSSEKDIPEILDLVERFKMKQIYLMAEGKTKQEQLDKEELVVTLCKKYNFNFSPRLHILKHGVRRKV